MPHSKFLLPRLRRTQLGVSVVTALALIPAATAQAADPAWLSPVDIDADAVQPSSMRVALDGQGDGVAVWNTCDSSAGSCVIRSAIRPAGGTSGWSSLPEPLATGERIGNLQLTIDSSDKAVAVWEEGPQNAWTVRAATRPAGGAWSPPENVSPSGASIGGAQLAFDPQGNALAVWTASVEAPCDDLEDELLEQTPEDWPGWAPQPCENGTTAVQAIQWATRPVGGEWSTPQNIATARYASLRGLQLAQDADGDAVAAWNRYNGTSSIVQAADYDVSGDSWSAPADVSPAAELQYAEAQQLALDAKGNAVVVWQTEYYIGRFASVLGASRRAGERWGPPEFVSPPYQHARDPEVTIDSQANAVAVWHGGASNNPESRIQTAIRPPAGTWSEWHDLVDTGLSSSPQLAADPEGDALAAIWTRSVGGFDTVEVATRPAGASAALWSAARSISTTGRHAARPQMALDPHGNGVAAWSRYDGAQHVVQAAGYDAAGPQLRSLQLPETATAGVALPFSVAPLDVWSPIDWTRWDFGDGAVAGGATVSHSYAAPGSYDVTVTSTDTLGHSSSEKRTLLVAPAPDAGAGAGGDADSGSGSGSAGGAIGGGGEIGDGPAVAEDDGKPAGDSGPAAELARDRLRARGLRRCLSSVPRRAGSTRRGSARRRCLRRYGRTPGRVANLRARSVSRTKIRLTFRAPGTNGGEPPAARAYLVKQSSGPIRGRRGFSRAQTLCNGACRFSVTDVGAQITLTITDLRPGTTYYYAIAARDNASRRLGPRSRTVSARTR